jgi:hypothetical protein
MEVVPSCESQRMQSHTHTTAQCIVDEGAGLGLGVAVNTSSQRNSEVNFDRFRFTYDRPVISHFNGTKSIGGTLHICSLVFAEIVEC